MACEHLVGKICIEFHYDSFCMECYYGGMLHTAGGGGGGGASI